jgi:hypothetical protein
MPEIATAARRWCDGAKRRETPEGETPEGETPQGDASEGD